MMERSVVAWNPLPNVAYWAFPLIPRTHSDAVRALSPLQDPCSSSIQTGHILTVDVDYQIIEYHAVLDRLNHYPELFPSMNRLTPVWPSFYQRTTQRRFRSPISRPVTVKCAQYSQGYDKPMTLEREDAGEERVHTDHLYRRNARAPNARSDGQ
jgi:hypothetical protein